jgi:hypothetical protein
MRNNEAAAYTFGMVSALLAKPSEDATSNFLKLARGPHWAKNGKKGDVKAKQSDKNSETATIIDSAWPARPTVVIAMR